jgi:glutaredoxin
MEAQHVQGEDRGKVMFYGLSTCAWCQKTRGFLDKLGVEYYYVDVDLLESTDRKTVLKEVKRWNPPGTFPTLVINDEECIIGYNEAEIKKKLDVA